MPSPMMEMEGAEGNNLQPSHLRPQMRCNSCWEVILANQESAQTCYRTSCSHLFCEKCAYKHFGGGSMICPTCRTDINATRNGSVLETTIHGITNPKRTEAIWQEMIANPSSCFDHFQRALDFIMFQLAQDSYRQEEMRRQMGLFRSHPSFALTLTTVRSSRGERFVSTTAWRKVHPVEDLR